MSELKQRPAAVPADTPKELKRQFECNCGFRTYSISALHEHLAIDCENTPEPAAPSAEGTKHDQGKPRVSLLPAPFVLGTAKALTFGANKYGAHNFKKGIQFSRSIDALLRHLFAWLDGEDLDPESGLNHLDHAAANLAMLAYMREHRPDLDDRKPENK